MTPESEGNDAGEADLLVPRVLNVPDDPRHAAWDAAPKILVDLIPQRMTLPWGGGTVGQVEVRGLTNGKWVAFRLAWENPDADTTVGLRAHRDSCALMFLAEPGPDLPPFTMGGPGLPVVVWQW